MKATALFLSILVAVVFVACAAGTPPPPPPTPVPTLTVDERGQALKAFKTAFDKEGAHRQHSVRWSTDEKVGFVWVVPPAGGRYRGADCSPERGLPEGIRCAQGKIENTTSYAMINVVAVCSYSDGYQTPFIGVGTIPPGEIGTWEWPHIASTERQYLCTLAWEPG